MISGPLSHFSAQAGRWDEDPEPRKPRRRWILLVVIGFLIGGCVYINADFDDSTRSKTRISK